MGISRLDHANLRTRQLDRMIAWYTEILGFKQGWRPDFGFPGAWMYCGDDALVHLVHEDDAQPAGDNLSLEHVAFSATGKAEFAALLEKHGEKCKRVVVPGAGIEQFNIWDPDGNHLHIDFREDEAAD